MQEEPKKSARGRSETYSFFRRKKPEEEQNNRNGMSGVKKLSKGEEEDSNENGIKSSREKDSLEAKIRVEKEFITGEKLLYESKGEVTYYARPKGQIRKGRLFGTNLRVIFLAENFFVRSKLFLKILSFFF